MTLSATVATGEQSTAPVPMPQAQVDKAVELQSCMKCHQPISRLASRPAERPIGTSASNKRQTSSTPQLPIRFKATWTLFEVAADLDLTVSSPPPDGPPFAAIPEGARAGRGVVYYDWEQRKVVEEHFDFCVPIFPGGDDFPCRFLGVEDKAYLITFNADGSSNCCMFLDKFGPPINTFIDQMTFHKTTVVSGRTIDWWLMAIPMPGPFGYGFDRDTGLPYGFWFQSINGWAQMVYDDVQLTFDDTNVFEPPEACDPARACELLGVDDVK